MLKQRGLGYLAVRRCSHKRARASPHPFKLSILLHTCLLLWWHFDAHTRTRFSRLHILDGLGLEGFAFPSFIRDGSVQE